MRKYLVILVCLMLVLGGCGYYSSGNTAEQALHNHLVKQNIQGAISIVSSRPITDGVIILYTKPLNPNNQAALFAQIVWQDKAIWYTNKCCDNTGSSLFKLENNSDPLVAYNAWLRGRRHILIGRILSPKVAFVEATFSDSTVMQDTVKDDAFAIVGPDNAINICEIRLYDGKGSILQRVHMWGRITNEANLNAPADCRSYP